MEMNKGNNSKHWQYASYKSNPKEPSCKKVCSPEEGHCGKRCEIQGGSQEMAVMV